MSASQPLFFNLAYILTRHIAKFCQLRQKCTTTWALLMSSDGMLLSDKASVMMRWQDHFSTLLNQPLQYASSSLEFIVNRVPTPPGKSWKVLDFFSLKFQDLESPGKISLENAHFSTVRSMSDWLWRANVNNSVLHAVYSFCLLQWTIPLNSVSKWLFFLIFLDIQVFVGFVKVLEKFLWGSWKVLEKSWIFFSKRVGTLCQAAASTPDPLIDTFLTCAKWGS